jgi:hypothetical protein
VAETFGERGDRESGQAGFEQQPLGFGEDQVEALSRALLRRLVRDRSWMEPGFHRAQNTNRGEF